MQSTNMQTIRQLNHQELRSYDTRAQLLPFIDNLIAGRRISEQIVKAAGFGN